MSIFNIGLSGLQAATSNLKVTGNNIANSGTVGFKESRTEFGDIFARSYNNIDRHSIGYGVQLMDTAQQFSQGNFEYSDNNLDLAISGEGFFVLHNTDGTQVYSRAGAFQVDSDGYVVNSSGQRLQTYAPKLAGSSAAEFNTGVLSDIQLSSANSAPQATGSIASQVNLSAEATPILDSSGALVAFDQSNPDTYQYSTGVTVYDSLGTPRTMTLYFQNTGAGTWNAYAELDGWKDSTNPNTLTPIQMTFDSNGNLTAPTGATSLSFDLTKYNPANGATIGTITPPATSPAISLDFTGTTQYGSKYSVNDLTQDGYTTGELTGVEVDAEGVVYARYTNDQSVALGQVALANFKNPQGLQILGNNNWSASSTSGEPTYNVAGTGNVGEIISGALESSNVDLSAELVNLITAQRSFQANSQTISAADQITQTMINLR